MHGMSSASNKSLKRENILGVGVHPVGLSLTLRSMADWISAGASEYICVTPAHSIMDCVNDESVRSVFNRSGLTVPDGMPLVWLLKLRGHPDTERVYGPDLLLRACEEFSSSGFRHYFYGSSRDILDDLIQNLQNQFPDLKVAGSCSPPYGDISTAQEDAIVADLQTSDVDILWVALGAPRQEKWMAEHIDTLNTPVMVGVGAAFDFLAGYKRQAPQWMRRLGLEWLFRLLQEPGRLWPRYRQYPRFILLMGMQVLGIKKFPMDIDGQNPSS